MGNRLSWAEFCKHTSADTSLIEIRTFEDTVIFYFTQQLKAGIVSFTHTHGQLPAGQ